MIFRVSVPVVGNPRGGKGAVVQHTVAKSLKGLIRVGQTVKDEDLCIGFLGGAQEIHGERGDAMALKAEYPLFGPPMDFLHCVSQEGLLCGV